MIEGKKSVPKTISTNNDYRNILVKNAFKKMKDNQIEYSKQSYVYIPREIQENKKR
tara:strand:- start:884 stop:1051 length:168 start_codon:yes stop_codon:yes gene_type:complete